MLLDHLQANSGWILIQKGCDKAGPLQVDVHLESELELKTRRAQRQSPNGKQGMRTKMLRCLTEVFN